MKVSQTEKLRRLLSDGQSHSTLDIMEKVYGGSHLGIARVGARIHDLKDRGHTIVGWKDEKNKAIYHYQMSTRPAPKYEYVAVDGVMHARLVPNEKEPHLV